MSAWRSAPSPTAGVASSAGSASAVHTAGRPSLFLASRTRTKIRPAPPRTNGGAAPASPSSSTWRRDRPLARVNAYTGEVTVEVALDASTITVDDLEDRPGNTIS